MWSIGMRIRHPNEQDVHRCEIVLALLPWGHGGVLHTFAPVEPWISVMFLAGKGKCHLWQEWGGEPGVARQILQSPTVGWPGNSQLQASRSSHPLKPMLTLNQHYININVITILFSVTTNTHSNHSVQHSGALPRYGQKPKESETITERKPGEYIGGSKSEEAWFACKPAKTNG